MRILNLLAEGRTGGIETLCNSIDATNEMNNYWCFFIHGGEIADEIKSRNPNKTFIFNGKLPIKVTANKINEICKKNNINIVAMHNGGIYCNILFYLLVKSNKNIKFIRFLHSCYEDKYFYPKNKIKSLYGLHCYNKALKKADLIVSVSKAVQKSYEEKFDIKNVNKVIIYNGINDKFISTYAKKRTDIKNRKCKIIYVGRLVKVKGVDILINAVKKLKEYNYNIQLTIVGDGEEKKSLEKLTKQLGIEQIVSFVGLQKNVIKWLDESDIFVYPPIWGEAFGISVVEAMARECIPVVSNKGGLPEVINDNVTGYLVKNLNSENLAQTIKKCIDNEIKGQGLDKEKIRKKAEEYGIDSTIEKLKEEYGKLMKQN